MPLFGPPNIEKLKQKGDVKELLKALNHKDPLIRLNAEKALNELATGDVEPIISAALYASNTDTHRWGMDALRKLGPAEMEPIITGLLFEYAFEAAEILGHLGIEAVGAFTARLEDENMEVRCAAAAALGELGDARATEALTTAPEDDDEFVRGAAAVALEGIGALEAEAE